VTDVDPVWKPKPRRTTAKARRRKTRDASYTEFEADRMARRPACVVCGDPATQLHHRRLLSAGGAKVSHANTVPVCGPWGNNCHGRIHLNVEWARARRLIVGRDDPDFALLGQS
jgi:hypothetical protein